MLDPNLLTLLTPLDLLALLAVVVIGLPHGALDGAVAMHLGFTHKILHLLRFLGLYIAVAAAVVATWLVAPALTLIAFLVISIFHFGSGDARSERGWRRRFEIIAHGGIVVVGISQMHHAEVDIIYAYLVGDETALVWQALDVMTVFVGVALVICLVQSLWHRTLRWTAVELLALTALFAYAPPLVGFAVYFCCVHSARHVASILRGLRHDMSARVMLLNAAGLTLASWVAGGAALWWFGDTGSLEPVLLRVVFIGLAALTVPHMILIDGFYRQAKPSLSNAYGTR